MQRFDRFRTIFLDTKQQKKKLFTYPPVIADAIVQTARRNLEWIHSLLLERFKGMLLYKKIPSLRWKRLRLFTYINI